MTDEPLVLDIFFTRALAKRVVSTETKTSPVIVNTVDPGFCRSNLRQYPTLITRTANSLMEMAMARTSEEGARELVWAALGSVDGDERALHGQYISDMRIVEPADSVVSEGGKKLEDRLWVRSSCSF